MHGKPLELCLAHNKFYISVSCLCDDGDDDDDDNDENV